MKKILLMLSALAICFASCQKVGTENSENAENTENTEDNEEEEGTELPEDEIIHFDDPIFLNALLSRDVDTNHDGQISVSEANSVKKLYLNTCGISDIS